MININTFIKNLAQKAKITYPAKSTVLEEPEKKPMDVSSLFVDSTLGGTKTSTPALTISPKAEKTEPMRFEFGAGPIFKASPELKQLAETVAKPQITQPRSKTAGDLLIEQLPEQPSGFAEKLLTPAAKAVIRLIEPVLEQVKDLTEAYYVSKELIPEEITRAMIEPVAPIAGGERVDVFETVDALKKTNAQVVGNAIQTVMTFYAPRVATRLIGMGFSSKVSGQIIRQTFVQGAKEGIANALPYGIGMAMSSGTKDPKKFIDITLTTAAAGAVLGGTISATAPAGRFALQEMKSIQNNFKQELIKNGIPTNQAELISTQGGFIGRWFESPKAQELGRKINELNKRYVKKPTKANKKALDAAIRAYKREKQAGFAKIPFLSDKKPKKPRKFITSAKEAPGIAPEVKAKVAGKYQPITNRETFAKAQRFVETDESAALLKLSEGKQAMEKLGADYTATAEALAIKYQQAGRFNEAASVINDAAETLTKGGQMIQAASLLNRLTPEGVLAFAQKRMGKAGIKLSDDVARQLQNQVRKIQTVSVKKPYEKFLETQELAGMIERNIPQQFRKKAKDWLFEIWTLPKTTAASFDLSAGARQGIFPLASFPKQWRDAFKAQFKAVYSEQGYKNLMNEIMLNPRFSQALEAKVSFADVAGRLSLREDRFMSTWAEKIPGIGKGIKASNRAYTGFLNKIRMDMFTRMADDAERLGIKIDNKWLVDTGKFINDATGRGSWKAFEGSANNILQGIMFSPRLMQSRLNILTAPLKPSTYTNLTPQVRKQLWKSIFAFAGTGASILGLASFIPGVDVGKDPRSADFGEIKIGNTRFDVWGGFQQYFRIAAQIVSGKYVSTTTGRVITLGEGYKPFIINLCSNTKILLKSAPNRKYQI